MKPSLEEVAHATTPAIEERRIRSVQVLDRFGEPANNTLQYNMVVIAHQAIGVAHDTVSILNGGQQTEKLQAIDVVDENGTSFVPACRDVKPCAGIVEPQWSRHLADGGQLSSHANVMMHGLTPPEEAGLEMAPETGLEPVTRWLTASCSTN